jgi:hypothetical protein
MSPVSVDGNSSVTHQLLRGSHSIAETITVNRGNLYINPMQRATSGSGINDVPVPVPMQRSQQSSNSRSIFASSSKTTYESTAKNTSEKASIFNATISFIADVDSSTSPETERGRDVGFGSCVCGRRRIGVWFPARGRFDSGSDDDFVSEDLIKRARLESSVLETKNVVRLKIFSVPADFNKTITLSWQLNNHEISYTREFYVASNADNFDMVIGEPFLMAHGYNIIPEHQSNKKTSFFGGFFPLRLPRESKSILFQLLISNVKC